MSRHRQYCTGKCQKVCSVPSELITKITGSPIAVACCTCVLIDLWNSNPVGYLKSNRNGPYIMQCGVYSFVVKTLELTLALKFFGSLMNFQLILSNVSCSIFHYIWRTTPSPSQKHRSQNIFPRVW